MAGRREEVEAFLRTSRGLVEEGLWTLEPRRKNLDGIAELGITLAQAEEIVAKLTVSNYSSGPQDDRDRPGEDLWIFGKSIERVMAYIKLKVEADSEGPFVKCLSFHPAEFEMTFPLRPLS